MMLPYRQKFVFNVIEGKYMKQITFIDIKAGIDKQNG